MRRTIILLCLPFVYSSSSSGAQESAKLDPLPASRVIHEGNRSADPIQLEVRSYKEPLEPGQIILEVEPQKGIAYYVYEGATLTIDRKVRARLAMREIVDFAHNDPDAFDIDMSELDNYSQNRGSLHSPARYVTEGKNRDIMFSIDLEPGVHIIRIAPDESLFRPGEGKRGRANPIGEASHMNTSTGYYYNPVLLNDAWGPLHYRDFVLQFKVLIKEGRTHYYEFSCDANKQTDGFFPKRGWANPKGANGEEGIDKTQFEFRMISVDDDLVVNLR